MLKITPSYYCKNYFLLKNICFTKQVFKLCLCTKNDLEKVMAFWLSSTTEWLKNMKCVWPGDSSCTGRFFWVCYCTQIAHWTTVGLWHSVSESNLFPSPWLNGFHNTPNTIFSPICNADFTEATVIGGRIEIFFSSETSNTFIQVCKFPA